MPWLFAVGEKRYYVGYDDGTLRRWDPEAGRELAFIKKYKVPIRAIAAPGGNMVAVALGEKNGVHGSVSILDAVSGTEKAVIGDWPDAPFAIAFSGDRSALAVVGGKFGKPGVARLWDARTGTVTSVQWPPPKHLLVAVALSPDARLLITSDDRNIRVWDLRQNKFAFRMRDDMPEFVQGVAFSPDGKLAAAVCSADSWESDRPGLLVIWNTADWSEAKRIPLDCGGKDIAFSPDNHYLAVTRRDNTVGLWKSPDWNSAGEILPMGGYISAITYTADGKSIASADHDNGVAVWQLP